MRSVRSTMTGFVAALCPTLVPTVKGWRENRELAPRGLVGPGRDGHPPAMDQHLLELAIRACGGEVPLARALQTDLPAIDWWRRAGVPDDMAGRIRLVAVEARPAPPLPPGR